MGLKQVRVVWMKQVRVCYKDKAGQVWGCCGDDKMRVCCLVVCDRLSLVHCLKYLKKQSPLFLF